MTRTEVKKNLLERLGGGVACEVAVFIKHGEKSFASRRKIESAERLVSAGELIGKFAILGSGHLTHERGEIAQPVRAGGVVGIVREIFYQCRYSRRIARESGSDSEKKGVLISRLGFENRLDFFPGDVRLTGEECFFSFFQFQGEG